MDLLHWLLNFILWKRFITGLKLLYLAIKISKVNVLYYGNVLKRSKVLILMYGFLFYESIR